MSRATEQEAYELLKKLVQLSNSGQMKKCFRLLFLITKQYLQD